MERIQQLFNRGLAEFGIGGVSGAPVGGEFDQQGAFAGQADAIIRWFSVD